MIHPSDTLLQKKMRQSQSDNLVKAPSCLYAPCEECAGGLGATAESVGRNIAIALSWAAAKP